MLKRIIIFALFVIAINTTVKAQPTSPGHIVFTGFQTSGATTATDQFSFVPLVSMPAGTNIKFTDNAWNSGSLTFNTTESNTSYTNTTGATIPAGTELRIILGPPALVVRTNGTSAGTVVVTGPISMPTTGEQMIAYIGAVDLVPTAFLSGFHNNVETGGCGVTTAAGWDPATCVFPMSVSNNTSMKPASLTTGADAFWSPVEHLNWKFTGCGLNLSTAGAIRTAVNNPANWAFDDSIGVVPPWGITRSGCVFLGVPTAASVSVSGRVFAGIGAGLPKARISLTDSQGNTRQALSSSLGYYRFDDIAVGQTITITVADKRYQFTPQVLNVTEDVEDLNFTAQ